MPTAVEKGELKTEFIKLPRPLPVADGLALLLLLPFPEVGELLLLLLPVAEGLWFLFPSAGLALLFWLLLLLLLLPVGLF